jgi:hypothetical protein
VVIHDLDVVCIATAPSEADPPLVVYPNAVLASATTAQRFQAVPGRYKKIIQLLRRIEHPELS